MKIVVLTGAGISQESGIKTFRDSNGLWENHDVMEVAHPNGWKKDRSMVNRFYNQRRAQLKECSPNDAHFALVELAKHHDVTIITQNVDNLHELAGSTNVLHLHGELLKVRDEVTGDVYDWNDDLLDDSLSPNGNTMRPHIVWFDESVPNIGPAQKICEEAELFLVIGTSLQVYPAAGLLHYVPKSSEIAIFATEMGDTYKSLYIVGKAGETVPHYVKKLIKE